MQGECVDAVIFDAIVWPRAAAAAEQLWSARAFTQANIHATGAANSETGVRLSKHRCMMVARGVAAAPPNDSDDPRLLNQGCQ